MKNLNSKDKYEEIEDLEETQGKGKCTIITPRLCVPHKPAESQPRLRHTLSELKYASEITEPKPWIHNVFAQVGQPTPTPPTGIPLELTQEVDSTEPTT